MKTETIAITFDIKKAAVKQTLDVLQYAVIGLGYSWPLTNFVPLQGLNAKVIYLNHKTHRLTWNHTLMDIKVNSYTTIEFNGGNLAEVVDFVKNPPPLPKHEITIEEICGDMSNTLLKFVVDVDNKSVSMTFSKNDPMDRRLVNNVKISADTIEKIGVALGNKKTLPLVSFDYPDSQTLLNRKRLVRLVQVTSNYIRGYELQDDRDEKGIYKQFSKSKVSGSIFIISFNDPL